MPRMSFLAAEAINYQNNTVFKELELAFRDIMFQSKGSYEEQRRQNEQLIEAILQNAFHCNASVNFGEYYPAMRIFDEYHNGVLLRNEYREYYIEQSKFVQRFIGANRNGQKAGVDINKAKLTGLFTELPFTVYLPDTHLCQDFRDPETGWKIPDKWRFTSGEMAAMVLHEMGHFFTYCEFFSRTVTTNQALTQLSKELDDCYSVEKREVLIARTAADLRLSELNVSALATNDKKSIIETAIVTEAVEQSRTELGVSIYDNTSSEFLADQFAARMGASRDLATGLAKFEELFGYSYSRMSMPLFMLDQLFSIFLTLFPYTAVVMAPINLLVIFFGGVGDDGDNTYDTPEVRFRRIRDQSVQRLKNRAISEAEKKQILEDLKSLDEVMSKFHDKREWREYIATTLIPVYRRHRKTKLLQQELEQLANNPLFVRAAELSTL